MTDPKRVRQVLLDLLSYTLEVGATGEADGERAVFRLTLPKAPHGA